ncbi:MAG: hypothetical protein WBQ94_22750, partial [Terracidiphilus sp.]
TPDTNAMSAPNVRETLPREVMAAGRTIAGIPGGIYHAFADPATAEETEEAGGPEQVQGLKRVGLGIGRLTAAPILHAADWYTKAAKGEIPNPTEQILSAAPEAIGAGAGNVIGGKLMGEAPGVVKKVVPPIVRGIAKGTNTVLTKAPGTIGAGVGAAAGHATGVPGASTIGAAVGAAVGHEVLPKIRIPGEHFGFPNRVIGGPKVAPPYEPPPDFPGAPLPEHPGTFPGANLPEHPGVFPGAPEPTATQEQLNPSLVSPSRSLPGQIGKEVIRPKIARPAPAEPIPARRGLALPPAPEAAPNAIAEPAPQAPAPIARPSQTPKITGKLLQQQIEESLGNKAPEPTPPLRPGVPLKRQIANAAHAQTPLPEGFTPVESTALKGYKYDPATREFEAITQDNQHYVHGDVPPEAVEKFTANTSKGKAWTELRNSPGAVRVAKVVNGQRISTIPPHSLTVDPASGEPTFEEPEIPKSIARPKKAAGTQPDTRALGDLQSLLEESLRQAQLKKAQ